MRYLVLLLVLLIVSCGQLELSDIPENNPSSTEPTLPDTDTLPSGTIMVSAIPSPCSIWQNHIVALVTPVPEASASGSSEALVTLISLYDWGNLPSALNETNPSLATSIAQGYQEYDLSDWRIPTSAEVKALKAAYSAPVPEASASGLSDILTLLMQAEGLPLILDARYLCEEGTKSFSFAPGSTISTAGTKTTTYRLRLVKRLRLKQQQ